MQRARNVERPTAAARAVVSGQPAPSCTAIGQSELQHFQDIVNQRTTVEAKQQIALREELRKTSEKRVADWPNTIEAQRIKKEKARRDRLDQEEERRKVIDKEEAALHQAQKEQAIRKANLQLYEENDRIKNFSSKLFLASVLDEREKQLAIREEKAALEKEAERHWGILQAEQLRKAALEEEKKIEDAKTRVHALKEAQLQQLEDIRKIKIKARDEDTAEGRKIRQAAVDAVEMEKRAEEERIAEQKAHSKQLVDANKEQKRIKQARLDKEKAEEGKIAEFAALKEAQMQERKKRMDDKLTAKLVRRQKLIDNQAQRLSEMQQATEEREMKALVDFEKQRHDREAQEAAARKKRQQEISDFRSEQLARKQLEKEKEVAEKQRMQGVWSQRAEVLIDEELEERKEQREAAERLQRIHLLQMHEKKQGQAQQKRSEIEEGVFLQQALKDEQQMYEDYVNSVMSEYARCGRSESLIKLAARKSRMPKSA